MDEFSGMKIGGQRKGRKEMVLCIIIGVVAGGSFCRFVFVNFKIASFVLLLFCQTSIFEDEHLDE